MSNQKPPTVKELIEQSRINLLSTQANANTTAVNSFDAVATQLIIFVEQSSKRDVEIQRLQELLRKNNIDFTLHVEPVKLSDNLAVVPESETPPTSES